MTCYHPVALNLTSIVSRRCTGYSEDIQVNENVEIILFTTNPEILNQIDRTDCTKKLCGGKDETEQAESTIITRPLTADSGHAYSNVGGAPAITLQREAYDRTVS